MPKTLTLETLIPISVVGFIGIGIFYIATSYAKVEENVVNIKKNETSLQYHLKEANKNYIEIRERLIRIEEAVKK